VESISKLSNTSLNSSQNIMHFCSAPIILFLKIIFWQATQIGFLSDSIEDIVALFFCLQGLKIQSLHVVGGSLIYSK
jgi:hypothetical protein